LRFGFLIESQEKQNAEFTEKGRGARGEHYNIRMTDPVRIGILGDFNAEFRSHHATNDSLQHAAAKLQLPLDSQWISTPSVLEPNAERLLEAFDGLWASPGSPYQSFDGMLKGIEFARRRDWPFFAT
jgi:CTP synthase (UTP-ammonia lyase)